METYRPAFHCLAWLCAVALVSLHTAPAQNRPSGERNREFQTTPQRAAPPPAQAPPTGNIVFSGNTTFTNEQLAQEVAEAITEIQQKGLTRPRADDLAFYVSVYYRKQGFAKADIRWDIVGSRLVLRISEGPRIYLGQIRFTGNKNFRTDILYDYMIGATEERLRAEPQLFPFVEADVKTGVARIRGLYESEGYLDAALPEPEITYGQGGTRAIVTVKITEGPRYLLGEVTFTGEPIYERSRLVSALGESAAAYTTQRVNAMQRNLEFFYKAEGYYQAEVTVNSDPKSWKAGRLGGRRVPATFVVKPGPKFRFDGVTVTGLERLNEKFIENRFRSLHGDVYNPAALDERFRELLRTGLFSNLRLKTTALPSNEVRIDLTAEEARAKEVGFSIGYGSYEGAIVGLRLGDRNWQGRGRPLLLDIDYSTRSTRAELSYIDPWLLESEFSMRSRLYVQSRTEEGYSLREIGGRVDLTRKLTPKFELGTFLQLENVEITETVIDPIYTGLTSYQVGTLGLTSSLDFRDNPVNPSKGWILNTAADVDTIAGEAAFGRLTLRFGYYKPIFRKMRLSLGFRGGMIYPLADIPIDERYFNGGSTTVRSFQERELGPKDPGGYPIGGQVFTVINAEVDFPITGALRGAVFADAGNVIAEFENAGVEDMRYGLGVGLRYGLPIGPVRLDAAVNPNPKQGEDWGAVHFSFGFAF